MYLPPHFRQDDLEAQLDLIRAHPLGLLISAGPEGPLATPVPFALDAAAGPFGTLRCHLARANPHWRALAEDGTALVVFTAADAYVSPGWYASKREHGKVVPTWNYATVQARGQARVHEDPAWLGPHVAALTDMMETGRPEPWAVTDAPEPFVAAQLRGIVGVEIEIASLAGKLKASQNRPEADRAGVRAGLEAAAPGCPMARMMREIEPG